MITQGDIPQGRATAMPLAAGERLRIINHLGQQVVDTWIFAGADRREYLSMEHCRDGLYKLFFTAGDVLVSNRRRALVRITEDRSPGRHDTLCAACDAASYAAQGLGPDHPNCRSNLARLQRSWGWTDALVPCPWNLFMDIPFDEAGHMSDRPSFAAPGDFVELEALTDIVLVCSPCPQQAIPISGAGRPVRGLRWERHSF